MNYLNLHTDTLKSDEFIGSEPVERATWICLLGWSCSQENSGVIRNCRDWNERKWQQLCGVTHDEVHAQSGLFEFDGDDLIIHYYPIDQEKEVIRKRRVAKKNGKLGGRPKNKKTNVGSKGGSDVGSDVGNQNTPISKPTSKSVMKGKERKGKERETPPLPPKGDGDGVSPPKFEIPTLDHARNFAASDPSMIPPDCVEAWHDDRTSLGWEKPKGQTVVPIKDWRADLRGYGRSWKENRSGKPDAPKPPPKPVEGPEGWREAFRELIPNGPIPIQWDHIDPELQSEIISSLKGGAA